jgi:pimeloyl-ACP methyl ester carboxylesterase
MQIRNGDVTLHVLDEGNSDGRPLLLLHGIISSTATYDFLLPTLASDHRVVRLDFRGHGASGRAPGAYGFKDVLTDAVAVCEQVIVEPCTVIGHSLGGGVAAALAQQRPDLVRAVVLEDPALVGADDVAELQDNSLMDAFRFIRDTTPHIQAMGMSVDDLSATIAAAPSAVGVPLGELVYPDAVHAMAVSLLQVDATVLDPVLDGKPDPAFDPYQAIPVVGLVLGADLTSPDAVVRQRDVDRLTEHSPLVEVRSLKGASHLIHEQVGQREIYVEAVTAFLAAHATP